MGMSNLKNNLSPCKVIGALSYLVVRNLTFQWIEVYSFNHFFFVSGQGYGGVAQDSFCVYQESSSYPCVTVILCQQLSVLLQWVKVVSIAKQLPAMGDLSSK